MSGRHKAADFERKSLVYSEKRDKCVNYPLRIGAHFVMIKRKQERSASE